jgi:hypothetical protein
LLLATAGMGLIDHARTDDARARLALHRSSRAPGPVDALATGEARRLTRRACAAGVRDVARVHKNLERGVSLDLVFAIDFIEAVLRRMEQLTDWWPPAASRARKPRRRCGWTSSGRAATRAACAPCSARTGACR